MRPGLRSPLTWSAMIVLAIVLGIGSRRFGRSLPLFVAAYAGDVLWALVVFLIIGLVLPRASTWLVAALALTSSIVVETSQLYHSPWINSIRHTRLGGLLLGYDFVASDLACYAVGVGLGVLIERTASAPRT